MGEEWSGKIAYEVTGVEGTVVETGRERVGVWGGKVVKGR